MLTPLARFAPSQTLDLIQFSDCHLKSQPDASFGGVQPYLHLQQVLQYIQQHEKVDCLLNTGDVAQDSCAETYQHYVDLIQSIDLPHFCLRGNHDDDASFPFAYADQVNWLDCGAWGLILLNSQKHGCTYGEISERDLQQLQQLLTDFQQTMPEKHLLVALHHHVLPVGSAWLDKHILHNAPALLDVLRVSKQVKLLITGHVHQRFESHDQHIAIYSCPATSVQFKPKQREFALEHQPPAYRRYHLHADGSFQTEVMVLNDMVIQIDEQLSQY